MSRPPVLLPADKGVEISVFVQPRSSRSKIVGIHDDTLKIKITKPPVDGQANDECCRVLARWVPLQKNDARSCEGHFAGTGQIIASIVRSQTVATYVILSKLCAHAVDDPSGLRQLAETVSQKIKAECPRVRWKDSYALMGGYDVVDIVEADSPADVEKAAMIIRSYGHASTETMHATPWKDCLFS